MQSYEIQPFRNIRPGFGHQSAWQWSGLALVFIALALLVGCGVAPEAAVVPTQAPTQPPLPTPTCAMQAAPFLKEIDPLAREWDDAVTLANSTPRASLSNQIEKLQALRRKVEALDAPECAAAVKAYLVDTMDAMTRGFIAFLGQKSDSQVQALFSVGKDEQAQFAEALQRVKAGKAVPPTEPMLKDGLGVTRAAIQGAYNDRKFTEDSLTTGEPRVMGVTAGGESLVELIGPAENVRQATLSASLGGAGEAQRLETGAAGLSQACRTGLERSRSMDWGRDRRQNR